MRHPDDYRLERWLAALFSLLFLLPVVADAQPLAPRPARPDCRPDVVAGSPTLDTEPDVRRTARAGRFETSIRVTAVSEGRPSC